jgi:rod shape-determining protein MreC
MLMRIASPFLRAGSIVTGGFSGIWHEYVDLRHTRSRNASLEERLAVLQLELQKLDEAGRENARLRALLDLKEAIGGGTVAARVIGNHSRGMLHTILVDRGASSGLKPNMAVVAAEGVVGRVWVVSEHVAKIQLLTDTAAGTAVLLQRTRVQGILLGDGSELCALEYVAALEDVQEKDLLVTSGLDGIYPKGLPVGRVAEVGPVMGLLKSVWVLPRVNFNKLEEVLILLSETP